MGWQVSPDHPWLGTGSPGPTDCCDAAAVLLRWQQAPASCGNDLHMAARLYDPADLGPAWQRHLDAFFGGSTEHARPKEVAGSLELWPGVPGCHPANCTAAQWAIPLAMFERGGSLFWPDSTLYEAVALVTPAGLAIYPQILAHGEDATIGVRLQPPLPLPSPQPRLKLSFTLHDAECAGCGRTKAWRCSWPRPGLKPVCHSKVPVSLLDMLTGSLPGFLRCEELLLTVTVTDLGGEQGPLEPGPRLLSSPIYRLGYNVAQPGLWGDAGFPSRRLRRTCQDAPAAAHPALAGSTQLEGSEEADNRWDEGAHLVRRAPPPAAAVRGSLPPPSSLSAPDPELFWDQPDPITAHGSDLASFAVAALLAGVILAACCISGRPVAHEAQAPLPMHAQQHVWVPRRKQKQRRQAAAGGSSGHPPGNPPPAHSAPAAALQQQQQQQQQQQPSEEQQQKEQEQEQHHGWQQQQREQHPSAAQAEPGQEQQKTQKQKKGKKKKKQSAPQPANQASSAAPTTAEASADLPASRPASGAAPTSPPPSLGMSTPTRAREAASAAAALSPAAPHCKPASSSGPLHAAAAGRLAPVPPPPSLAAAPTASLTPSASPPSLGPASSQVSVPAAPPSAAASAAGLQAAHPSSWAEAAPAAAPAGGSPGSDECVICLYLPRTAILIPCGHFVLCRSCADDLLARPQPECPICRAAVELAPTVFR
ncbi:hypothetical protein ABPG75_013620 [Micractinium tetrahymenae]